MVGVCHEVNTMNNLNLINAVDVRCSRRKYLEMPVDPTIASKLRAVITEYNQATGIRLELVVNNGKAFSGFTKSYGMFSGVNNYVCLIADKNNDTAIERLGYYGELLVLHATALGLGTCWVGGAFSRDRMPVKLLDSEKIVCAILMGSTDKKYSFKEKLIHGITHRKTKKAEEMVASNDPLTPDWFMQGMRAVQKAPSALNRQPVMFSYKDGKVYATVKDVPSDTLSIDFGIAKLHFEIGSGGGRWLWGNGEEFVHSSHTDTVSSSNL